MENKKITVTSKEQMESMLACFRMLELVAQSPEDFNPLENLNENDAEYLALLGYYDQKTATFDYKKFMSEQLTKIGAGFQNVLMGYEELFIRYCDPALSILTEKENLVQIEPDQYLVRGKMIAEFNSKDSYKRGLSDMVKRFSADRVTITILDKTGCSVTATDIYNNPEEDFYPIKVYLNTTPENYKLSYKSLSNN